MRSGFSAALIISLAFGAAAPVLAHTAVTKTSIAENAKLAASPPEFTATFQHETSIVAVKLENSSGQQIQLNHKPTPASSKTFKLTLPALQAGQYTLSWRAVAKDGHVMPGAVHFSITG